MRPDAQRTSREGIEFLRSKENNIVHSSRVDCFWTRCEDAGYVDNIGNCEQAFLAQFTTCLWCARC